MTDFLTILIVVIIAFLLFIVIFTTIAIKKNKNNLNKAKEDKAKLAYTLSQTKQHLKYKKAVNIQTLLAVAVYILTVLGITLFIFLPIFELKIELLDEEIYTQSFSYYDAFAVLKDEYNESLNHFTDIGEDILSMALFFPYLGAIIDLVFVFFFDLKSTMSSDERTVKLFTEVKISGANANNPRIFNKSLASLVVFMVAYFIMIMTAHSARFKLTSDLPYTIETIGRYSYYSIDGNVLFRVYQNNFVFWNGVSGLIALPIICFVVAIALFITKAVLAGKLMEQIKNEEVSGFEKTTESSN